MYFVFFLKFFNFIEFEMENFLVEEVKIFLLINVLIEFFRCLEVVMFILILWIDVMYKVFVVFMVFFMNRMINCLF